MTAIPSFGDLTACAIEPFPYQSRCFEDIRAEYRKKRRSTLAVLATGTGKTVIAGFVARMAAGKGKRVLFVAPTIDLVGQAADTFEAMGLSVDIERAQHNAQESIWGSHVVVACTNTLKGTRLASWPTDAFDLIICDEAHRAVGEMTRRILKHFHSAKVLGLTATPNRADEKDLGIVFESVAFRYPMRTALQDPDGPFLSNPTIDLIPTGLNLRNLKRAKGDFSPSDLEDRMKPVIPRLSNAILQEQRGKRFITFVPSVACAEMMAYALRNLGLSVISVHGKDPDRDTKIRDLKRGEYQGVVSCQQLCEGFDCPDLEDAFLCRPTKSLSLLTQMCGRVTRLSKKTGKDGCRWVDFAHLTEQHDVEDILASPVDLLLSPDDAPEVRQAALKLLGESKSHKATELVDRARKSYTAPKIDVVRKKFGYTKYSYQPVNNPTPALLMTGKPESDWMARNNPATEEQYRTLREMLHTDDLGELSRGKAGRMIAEARACRMKGLCTYWQRKKLVGWGVPVQEVKKLSVREASDMISEMQLKRA